MHKARLVKKDMIQPDQRPRSRKAQRSRKQKAPVVRTAVEVTTEWINSQRKERPCAREAFAALFAEPEAQSA